MQLTVRRSPRAGRTSAEYLQSVAYIRKAVFDGDALGPPLNGRPVYFDRRATRPAHEMVVVPATAPAVHLLARDRTHDVDVAGLGERLECAVDSGQAQMLAAVAQHRMQFLCTVERLRVPEEIGDRAAL